MKKLKQFFFFMMMFSMFIFASCESGDETDEADTTSPTVVSLDPDNNATGVDAAITKITVTFSEPMTGYSIGMGTNTFPVDMANDPNPEWKDSKTLEIYVTLTGGTVYDLVLNHDEYTNFKDVNGNILESYTWKFTTE